MYPNLYYAFKDIFHIEIRGLMIFNSFGLFVALAFLFAAWVLQKELIKKEKEGWLSYHVIVHEVGKPASFVELFLQFILGFILGFKIIGALGTPNVIENMSDYVFSGNGSVMGGLLIGLILGFIKWKAKEKIKLVKPEKKSIRYWPHDTVSNIVVVSIIFGFLGAKLFDDIEHWQDLIQHPITSIFSVSGFAFYGGLICAAIALFVYTRKKIPFIHLCDATAPALMLAYGIGRIGCQVSGDGDWGILNSTFISNTQGEVVKAMPMQWLQVLKQDSAYYIQQFGSINKVPHLSVLPWKFIPNWLVAYNFPHNVLEEGIKLAGSTERFTSYLPIPVFPTSFYETIVCLLLFFILMVLRKTLKLPGQIFALYLILNGFERYFIENIRVNKLYLIGQTYLSQAQIISIILIAIGIAMGILLTIKPVQKPTAST